MLPSSMAKKAHGVKERCRVGHTERPSREELQVQHRFEVVGRLVQEGAAKDGRNRPVLLRAVHQKVVEQL
jgi:hypothetical protein